MMLKYLKFQEENHEKENLGCIIIYRHDWNIVYRMWTAAHIEAVRGLFKGRTGASVSLAWGLTANQVYGDVHIQSRKEKENGIYTLEWETFPYEKQQIPEKTYTKWFDYDKIKNSPCVRTRRQGDYLTVNSEGGKKKLNRIFIDEKIPAEMRDRLPVVAAGSEILWIPGGRMNEKYKITSTTGRVLELHYQGGALA